MTDPDNARRAARLGTFVLGIGAVLLLTLMSSMGGGPALVEWLVVLVLAGVGVGLLRNNRLARGAGVLLFGLCAIATSIGALRHLVIVARTVSENLLVYVTASFAASLLVVYLCIRAILVLLGRARENFYTPRIVGVGLALTALVHLRIAITMRDVAFDLDAHWLSIGITQDGIVLMGFPLWPAWHAMLAIVGGVLAATPRRYLASAASILVAVFGLLVVLVALMAVRTATLDLISFSIPVLLAAMAWWLRVELCEADPTHARP